MDILAAYDSSSSSSSSSPPPSKKRRASRSPPPPPKKKKKLIPPAIPVHTDDPAQHQGRTRTTPHVEGQFAAHVYVRVPLEEPGVRRLVRGVRAVLWGKEKRGGGVAEEKGKGKGEEGGGATIYPCTFDDSEEDEDGPSLHISLTRGVFLRAHQRARFFAAVRAIARRCAPFAASLTTPAVLTNDTRTRAFVVLEVGAGHNELHTLTSHLTPTLSALHQSTFYEHPRFHASVAWALLPGGGDGGIEDEDAVEPAPNDETPLHVFLPALFSAAAVTKSRSASFEVTRVYVKVGRDVRGFDLGA